MGAAYYELRDTPNAIKAYEECLVINPADTVAKQELEKLRKPNPMTGAGGLDGLENIGNMFGMGRGAGAPAGGAGGVPPNFMEMMNNPQFLEMATQMMQNNPQLMQMAQQVAQNPQLMQQFFGGNAPDLSSMGIPPPNQ